MAKAKPHQTPPPSPAKRWTHSFLHPQDPGEVWTYLPLWLLVAFVLRATVALSGDFLLHPDEVMQYLEPAHQQVFGNGVASWEQFYGARSWIVPGVITVILWLCTLIGLDAPQSYIPIVKLLFCAVSLAIPLGMYLFCRRHWGEPSARLALVLGVFWYEFVAFAHKPMTEFAATALLCLLLAVMPLRTSSRAWHGWAAAGALGALATALRFQYAPLIGLALLVGASRARLTGWLAMLGGGVAVLCGVGALETWNWGMPFHSYWANVKLNIVLGVDHGEPLPTWYLLHASCGLVVIAVAGVIWHIRRRGLVVLLLAAVMIPHMLAVHREYRYVFAAVPLWLMLFADVVAVTSGRFPQAGAWIRRAGVGTMVLVSVAGICNAIPGQNSIYKAYSKENDHFSFLLDPDPALQLYRRLSNDDAVRGLMDASQLHATSGGYYYLHRSIPFYALPVWEDVVDIDRDPADYVSHIITRTTAGGGQSVAVQDSATGKPGHALETDYGYELFPVLIGDSDSGELVYWRTHTRRQPQQGYTMVEQVGDLVLWHNPDAPPPKPWRNHVIYTFTQPRSLRTMQRIFNPREYPIPPPNYGIVFTDD